MPYRLYTYIIPLLIWVMASNVIILENDVIKGYINDYEQKIIDIKNKSNNYLKNSKVEDFMI